MNWEALGAIGEVVGAVGVIATLVYLAIQIRQNTASVRASTFHRMIESTAELQDMLASDPRLGRIFTAGTKDLAGLSEKQRASFHFIMMGFFRRVENMHFHSKNRMVSPGDWAGIRESALSVVVQPGTRAWWAENRYRFNAGFADWLEKELETRAP